MRIIEKADIAPLEPLLCSIKAGTVILGVSDRLIVDLVARNKIKAVKSERRTLLVVESLKQYAAELPKANGTLLARHRRRIT